MSCLFITLRIVAALLALINLHFLLPPTAPISPPRKDVVLGFYTGPEDSLPSSQGSYQRNKGSIDQVAFFSHELCGDGSVTGHSDFGLVQTLHRAGQQALGVIFNAFFINEAQARSEGHELLANATTRQGAVTAITQVALRDCYDGIVLDIEALNGSDRDLFSAFSREPAASLHHHARSLTIAVVSKTWDAPNSSWAGMYDYSALGQVADQVAIMAYDEHGYGSSAGPLSSPTWVEEVIQYAVGQLRPSHILLGLAGFGFDWGDKVPHYMSIPQVEELQATTKAILQWDDVGQSPHFSYQTASGEKHEVWWENRFTWARKLALVDKYSLRGVAIWRLGLEDPSAWQEFTK